MDSTYELWLFITAVLWLAAYFFAEWRESRKRLKRTDYVADYKRRVTHRGFKSRMGIR